MATKKKTTPEPKTYTLSEEQIKILKDISTDLMDIRRTLNDLEGEENISTVMFKVGMAYISADRAETAIDSLLDEQFGEDCDECGDGF